MSPLQPVKKEEKLPEGIRPEQLLPAEIEKIEPELAPEKIKPAEGKAAEKTKQRPEQKLPPKVVPMVDLQVKAVQDIMQDKIKELYVELSPAQQKQFRDEGVRTAKEISGLLNQMKVNVKRILELIKRWLSRLPGINKYFLEQESKIKLDRLLEIKRQREEQGNFKS